MTEYERLSLAIQIANILTQGVISGELTVALTSKALELLQQPSQKTTVEKPA